MTDTIWPAVHAERAALAEDLAGLSDKQWTARSLCSDWDVHEVLAHLTSAAEMTPPKFVAKFAKAGFDFNRFTAREVARRSKGGPAATLAAFRAVQTRTSAPPGPKDTWLGEAFVHGEDIRRPLGITRTYPMAELARALRFYAKSNAIIGGRDRVAGLTLQACDTDLTIGAGPLVEGPAMSLLLAASGRACAVDDLSGPGLETLRQRM